jgi:hypothetical protein
VNCSVKGKAFLITTDLMAVLKNARILQMNATIVYRGVYVAEGQLNGAFWLFLSHSASCLKPCFLESDDEKCYLCLCI